MSQERLSRLQQRWLNIEKRIDVLEKQVMTSQMASVSIEDPAETDPAVSMSDEELLKLNTTNASPLQQRLHQELIAKGVPRHLFIRAPPEYYQRDLVFRKGILHAASVFHLCKSIVMENTRAGPEVTGWDNPLNSKYYMIIMQYTYKLDTTKLDMFIHKLNEGRIPRKQIHLRVAPQEVGCKLSGFGFNAVTPVGSAARLPIIMSSTIAKLKPDWFWMGGGEVDLKLGMSAADFIKAYDVMVADIVDTNKILEAQD